MTTRQRCEQTIVPAPKYPNHPWLHEKTRLLTCSNGYNRDFAEPAPEPEDTA